MLTLPGFDQRDLLLKATAETMDKFISNRLQNQTIVFALDGKARPGLDPKLFPQGSRNHDLPFGADDSKHRVHMAYIMS